MARMDWARTNTGAPLWFKPSDLKIMAPTLNHTRKGQHLVRDAGRASCRTLCVTILCSFLTPSRRSCLPSLPCVPRSLSAPPALACLFFPSWLLTRFPVPCVVPLPLPFVRARCKHFARHPFSHWSLPLLAPSRRAPPARWTVPPSRLPYPRLLCLCAHRTMHYNLQALCTTRTLFTHSTFGRPCCMLSCFA